MILLDTTVLAYAVGNQHDLRQPCQDLFAAIGNGEIAATSTVEVLQEFTHVRARRHGRPEAVSAAERFTDLLTPLIMIDEQDLRRGLAMFQLHDRLGAFDAVLAAAAANREHITGLASADRAFANVTSIRHFAPQDADFLNRIRER